MSPPPGSNESGWTPGATVGPYRLLHPIGAGGMGAVYEAEDPRTGARYAIKSVAVAGDPELLLRFRREGEAQASVDRHENVGRVHAAGEAAGRAYLVLDLVTGGDLEGRLRREGKLAPRVAAELVRDLALGLAHVHAQGVLHRDLKPGNVMFDEAGTPKLVDFGLAHVVGLESLTQSGSLLGTPSYMAPEQAEGRHGDVGPATDVFALGAILHEALTGERLFRGESLYAVLEQVLRLDPPPPGVDPSLDAICLRCLAKTPADRYPSAAALADDLDRWLGGARTVPSRSWPRVAGLVIVCGLGVGLALRIGPGRDPGPTVDEATVSDRPGSGTGGERASLGSILAAVENAQFVAANEQLGSLRQELGRANATRLRTLRALVLSRGPQLAQQEPAPEQLEAACSIVALLRPHLPHVTDHAFADAVLDLARRGNEQAKQPVTADAVRLVEGLAGTGLRPRLAPAYRFMDGVLEGFVPTRPELLARWRRVLVALLRLDVPPRSRHFGSQQTGWPKQPPDPMHQLLAIHRDLSSASFRRHAPSFRARRDALRAILLDPHPGLGPRTRCDSWLLLFTHGQGTRKQRKQDLDRATTIVSMNKLANPWLHERTAHNNILRATQDATDKNRKDYQRSLARAAVLAREAIAVYRRLGLTGLRDLDDDYRRLYETLLTALILVGDESGVQRTLRELRGLREYRLGWAEPIRARLKSSRAERKRLLALIRAQSPR